MSDGSALSSVLEADRARLKDVEAQILELEQTLDLLRRERAFIKGRLDIYRYPVLSLPNEIISEIFEQFLPAYPGRPPMTGLFSPTLLTHICRGWREIALTTPSLWRAIQYSRDLYDAHGVHMLQSWLVRSRSCPISIKIGEVPYGVQEDLLKLLLSHCSRWEYLDLCINFRNLLHTIVLGATPLLRKLDLRTFRPSSSPLSLMNAPLLRTVSMNDNATDNIILPWANLTSLTLRAVYPHECTPILLLTCSLVHCELRLFLDDSTAIQPEVQLSSLESLTLIEQGEEDGEETEYLGTFTVPRLRKLQVQESYIGTDPITALASFIAKSGCKLQEVSILGFRSISKELYCKSFPLVSSFSFDDENNEDVDGLA
ncbi:hypothetical protein C8R43DRAFT_311883 [Mycena crocata]|nr:hypothetical protein C8R43DRAFT_311883 [Mycena crocata]